ncbi:transcriptional regulator FtsR [Dermabacteraceae bacterium P13115]
MAASAFASPGGASGRFSIGQVIGMLREEFPTLRPSKLHFLESQGLISPSRTEAGYRKYSRDDVTRLQFILRAQRDWRWQLSMIADHIEKHGCEDGQVTSIAAHRVPVRLSAAELRSRAQLDDSLLEELFSYGFLDPQAAFYGQAELDLALAARKLADEGLHPRHLTLVRTAVGRHAHLVHSVSLPHEMRRAPEAKEQAKQMTQELAESLITIYSALLRDEVSKS